MAPCDRLWFLQAMRAERTPAERLEALARRAQIAPGVVAGVTEPMIAEMVRRFYGRVRADDLLGPMFESRIDDWEACDAVPLRARLGADLNAMWLA